MCDELFPSAGFPIDEYSRIRGSNLLHLVEDRLESSAIAYDSLECSFGLIYPSEALVLPGLVIDVQPLSFPIYIADRSSVAASEFGLHGPPGLLSPRRIPSPQHLQRKVLAMTRLTLRTWVLAIAVSLPAFIEVASAQSKAGAAGNWPQLKFEKYKLKNGLEVILSEDHRLPLVAANVYYHVGPAYEKPGRTGFAHLFEHMMFQGSKNVGEKAHDRYLEAAGASDINGTTNFDRTDYYETVPSNQLDLALWLESDRMGFLLETLDGPKLVNQRDVVRNERRQGENSPYQLVEEQMYQAVFLAGHPYHGVVIGSHADIESARLNDVREFFRQYYTPNNASLAIVGDFDPKTIKATVEKYFGPIPSGPAVLPVNVAMPVITQEKRLTVTDDVELPRVYMAWLTAPVFKPGSAEADLLARIIGGGNRAGSTRSWCTKNRLPRTWTRTSNGPSWDHSGTSRQPASPA
jgi:hypothetical protein